MASNEMSEWIKFFTSAGVPAGAATTYAVTFIDNRIQKTMLLDITKEYLKEMGITVMGDIISILKYCKTYHAQYERDKPAISAMPIAEDGKVEVKRQTTAGSRMLEHYMRKQGVMDVGECKVKVSADMAARLGAVPAVGANKKSITMPQSVEVVPVKKVRRVTPEQEGKYIINMPEGSTPKTKKILEEQRTQAAALVKKTVFDRLGGANEKPSPIKKLESPNSVFSRLGGKKRVRSLSETSDSICEYEGVLRTPPNSTGKIATSVSKTKTMTSLSAGVASRLGAKKVTTLASDLTLRLGVKTPPKRVTPPVTLTSSTSKMDQINLKMNIKERLGPQKPEVSSTSQIETKTQAKNTAVKKAMINLDKSVIKNRLGATKGGLGIKKGTGVTKRLGTQLKPKDQTVTVCIPKEKSNLRKSTGMFSRLGKDGFAGSSVMVRVPKDKESLGQGMLARLGTTTASPSVKGRLGIQKVEASSTTPSITVMINQKKAGLQTTRLNKKKNLNLTRTVSNAGVFSRLGKSE